MRVFVKGLIAVLLVVFVASMWTGDHWSTLFAIVGIGVGLLILMETEQ